MNQYVTGAVIRELREKNHLTQLELASRLNVSDKAVSKWENGKGYPDIALLEPIANEFGISVTELISGNIVRNVNVAANMLRSNFYVCPVCGNMIHSMGQLSVCCHGIPLLPLEAEESDDSHPLKVEKVEDEYYVNISHEMTRQHYISFVAAASSDRIQIVKLYPEGNAQARFKINGVRELFYYCNKDGLFKQSIKKLERTREG